MIFHQDDEKGERERGEIFFAFLISGVVHSIPFTSPLTSHFHSEPNILVLFHPNAGIASH